MSNEYHDTYLRILSDGLEQKRILESRYGTTHYGGLPYEKMSREDRDLALYLPDALSGEVYLPRQDMRELRHRFSFAVPTDEAINCIVRHSSRGLVEVGAGGGYWSKLIAERGVDVLAFDYKPYVPYGPGRTEAEDEGELTHWFPVEEADATVAGKFPDRTLFLCWPPYNRSMAVDALTAYEDAGGNTLIYVGEGHGGCTGDDSFHDKLCDGEHFSGEGDDWGQDPEPCERGWRLAEEVHIPQWRGLHDRLYVYRRASV